MNEVMSAISICLLLWILLGPYNRFRVERVRQELFALRDQLFDEARAGRIGFDSNAYQATRTVLNGAIRFAHRVSFSRLLSLRLLMRRPPVLKDDLAQAMQASSEADRNLCKNYLAKADILMIKYVLSSPFVLALLVPHIVMIVLARIGYSAAEALVRKFTAEVATFNKLAYMEGRSAN